MNRLIPLAASLAFLISSCSAAPQDYVALQSRAVDVMNVQSVSIQVDYGEVTILQSEDSQLHIKGQVLFPDKLDYQINTTEKQIFVKVLTHRAHSSKAPVLLIIRVPQASHVQVESDTASIIARKYQGNLDVD